MTDTESAFGAWLRAWRASQDLTRPALARQAGCAVSTIARLERGGRPSPAVAARLAAALDIPAAQRPGWLRFARGAEPAPAGGADDTPAAAAPEIPPPHNLPVPATRFLGRAPERALALALLARPDVRLLTILGAPGIGKTRLGLEVAARAWPRFPHGVCFVHLGRLSNPGLVAPAIAQALGVRETAGASLPATLRAHLRDKRLLLVLDDFDPVLRAARLVADLLADAPGLKVLVTSRTRLRLAEEQTLRTPPLALPARPALPALAQLGQVEAVALFLERAAAAQPGFRLTDENAEAVVAICRQLDGIPLALELAAGQLSTLPPATLREHLASRLQPSTESAGPPAGRRPTTLRTAIDWSYHELDSVAQRLFRDLAVFVGGCSEAAAQAVLGAGPADLGRLVDASLLQVVSAPPQDPAGAPRYAMLAVIREYAEERLRAREEADALQRRYVDYFAVWLEDAARDYWAADQAAWLDRLDAEHDNLRAILRWALDSGMGGLAARLCGALWRFWEQRGYWSEGRAWLDAVLAVRSALPASDRARVLDGAGLLAAHQGDYTPAVALLEEATLFYRQLDDPVGLADTLSDLQFVAMAQGDYPRLAALASECLALYRALDDPVGIARALRRQGIATLAQGDPDGARAYFEQSLALDQAHGNTVGVASALGSLGETARARGDYTRAGAFYRESLALYRTLGPQVNIGNLLQNLGYVAQHQGDFAAARALFRESVGLARALGDRRSLAGCLEGLAGVAVGQGDAPRAAHLFGAATALHDAIGAHLHQADLVEYTRNLAATQALLAPAAFQAAWDAGQALSLDAALALATQD